MGDKARALGWAVAVTGTEAVCRRLIRSRSAAWIVAYSALGALAAPHVGARRHGDRGATGVGLALACGGYPAGRLLLGDRPIGAPPDPAGIELLALGGAVATTEELIWGGIVEPSLGIGATSALFAAKHAAVDGRWRRGLGLSAFWTGLGLIRRRSPRLAWAVHAGCNATGVLIGHITGRDQF